MSPYPPIANSREIAATTAGIARQLNPGPDFIAPLLAPMAQGGGNLNGSQNTAHMAGQAGTNGSKNQMPRHNVRVGGGNYCGLT